MPTVEQKRQPPGIEGARFTAREAVALAKKHCDDPEIRSWCMHALAYACPNLDSHDMKPSAQVRRAACLFQAFQDENFIGSSGWAPDQKGRENLDSPVLTLGDGTKRPFFPRNDCSNRGLAIVAACLCILNVVDVSIVLLGHGYKPGSKEIGHILFGIGHTGTDERGNVVWKQIWRCDPSQKLPFGEVTPWEWEYVIDAATGAVICDDRVCLRVGGAKMGKIAKVAAGAGGHVDIMNVTSGIPANTAGREPTEEDLEWWATELGAGARNLRDAARGFEAYADAVGRILADAGVPLTGSFTAEKQAQALTVLAMANLAARFLQEGADGKRPLTFTPEGDWALSSLPTDTQALGGDASSIWIQDVATGQKQSVPIGTGGNTAGSVWIIVGVAVGGLALWGAVAWNLYRAIEAWRATAQEVGTVSISQAEKKCLEDNDAAACARLSRARAEIERARKAGEIESEKTKQRYTDLAMAALVVGAGVATFLGARWAWEEFKLGKRSKNPGSKGPPQPTDYVGDIKVRWSEDRPENRGGWARALVWIPGHDVVNVGASSAEEAVSEAKRYWAKNRSKNPGGESRSVTRAVKAIRHMITSRGIGHRTACRVLWIEDPELAAEAAATDSVDKNVVVLREVA